MPASEGTPDFIEKLFAPIGLGPLIGMTPEEVTATVTGDKADRPGPELVGPGEPRL